MFFSNTAITSKPLTFSDSFDPAAELEILVFSQKEIKVALSNTNFPFVSAQFNIPSQLLLSCLFLTFILWVFPSVVNVDGRLRPGNLFSLFYFSTSFWLHNNKTVKPQIIGLEIHNCLCASFVTLNYKQAPSCLFALNSAYSIIQEKLCLKFVCPLSFFLSYCHVIWHLSGKRPTHIRYDIIWYFQHLAKHNVIFGKKKLLISKMQTSKYES